MPKKTIIKAKLESVAPQRQQYRPYLFNLLPLDTFVEIELDEDQIVSKDKSEVVLNLDGFKAVLATLADAVDEIHDAYVIKARKAGKY